VPLLVATALAGGPDAGRLSSRGDDLAFATATGAAWIAVPIVALALAAALAALRGFPIALRAARITATSGAASLVITPYAHPYDMLLAFPLLARATIIAPPAKRRWILLAGIAIFVLGPLAAALGGAANPVLSSAYALLPAAMLVLSAMAASGSFPKPLRCDGEGRHRT